MSEQRQRRDIDGRPAISRSEAARIARVSLGTVNRWYAQRADNGHPTPVAQLDQREWFDEDRWRTWHEGYLTAKKVTLTTPNRGGDPDELINATQFGRVLGYTNPGATILTYLRKNPGYLPEPDDTEPLPSGRVRRLWYRRTAWAFADSRDRRGGARPAGTGTGRRPRYADGHPLLDAVRAALAEHPPPTGADIARRLGISPATASRLIAAARNQPENPHPSDDEPTENGGPR